MSNQAQPQLKSYRILKKFIAGSLRGLTFLDTLERVQNLQLQVGAVLGCSGSRYQILDIEEIA